MLAVPLKLLERLRTSPQKVDIAKVHLVAAAARFLNSQVPRRAQIGDCFNPRYSLLSL